MLKMTEYISFQPKFLHLLTIQNTVRNLPRVISSIRNKKVMNFALNLVGIINALPRSGILEVWTINREWTIRENIL